MFDNMFPSIFGTSVSPGAASDVPPDFDWTKGETQQLRHGISRQVDSELLGWHVYHPLILTVLFRRLAAQSSINNPLHDWSKATSPTQRNYKPTLPSIDTYNSDNQAPKPSAYACISAPSSGVQSQPIIHPAPTPHTPTPRTPASLGFERPSSSASNKTFMTESTLPLSTLASCTTARSTPHLSTPTSYATARSTVSSAATVNAPPTYEHYPRCLSPILGQPNGQEEIEVESDSEGREEYEGMVLYDTGYQSVEDAKVKVKVKPLSKAVANQTIKGRRSKSPPKSRATIEDEDDKDEDSRDEDSRDVDEEAIIIEDPVEVKQEPVKEKKRVKPAIKRVPFGTTWTGPCGGELEFNAKAPRPEGWADGVYRWTYSTEPPVSAAATDRMPGDVHFGLSTWQFANEDEPFTSWVARGDSTGLRWVQFTAGQSHPKFKGWVFQDAKLPKTPPRWVKEATFKAKF
ncbi:hypothetical protein FRC10_011077 [Ceratobasidium sp. 414]|nr:hypothetical protein FRC10_011077 [Ceratobasidium sp. 414]